MSIRNTVKALVISDGKLLMNRCVDVIGDYFSLPGDRTAPIFLGSEYRD